MSNFLKLFWMFVKVNLLTTSGPASVGLLYKEAVGTLMSESDFIEAVGFSSALPGSDALQLAMFVGHTAGGLMGALAALLGSIMPPTVLMLGIISILQWLRGESWITNFVQGLAPAVAVLMVMVAWQVFSGEKGSSLLVSSLIAAGSLIAFLLKVPAPVVLLAAGLIGVVVLR